MLAHYYRVSYYEDEVCQCNSSECKFSAGQLVLVTGLILNVSKQCEPSRKVIETKIL